MPVKREVVPPEQKALFGVLEKPDFDPSASMERQIAEHIKGLIFEGKLPASTRLPAIRFLTELWGTTFFAIQAAFRRLAAEGYVTQSTMRGTFVADSKRKLQHVCLYHNGDFHSGGEFNAQLNIWLYRLLSERNISAFSFFDDRKEGKKNSAPSEIQNLVRGRQIDAVIASRINVNNTPWLQRLGVPVASIHWQGNKPDIQVDLDAFIQLSVKEAVRQNRKKIGLIYLPPVNWTDFPPTGKERPRRAQDRLFKELKARAKTHGISVVSSPLLNPTMHWEQYAVEQCERLFARSTPPDTLVVYPDSQVRGVSLFLAARQLNVPKDVLIISHRNQETTMYTPFPTVWLTVKIEDFARRLLEDIDHQIDGKPAPLAPLPVSREGAGVS